MEVILSSSCSTDKDFIQLIPISGKSSILKSKIKPGVWTKTLAIAKNLPCKSSGGPSPSVGQACSQYGSGGSGRGTIIQKTKAKDGGSGGVPYTQEIITITGAS